MAKEQSAATAESVANETAVVTKSGRVKKEPTPEQLAYRKAYAQKRKQSSIVSSELQKTLSAIASKYTKAAEAIKAVNIVSKDKVIKELQEAYNAEFKEAMKAINAAPVLF